MHFMMRAKKKINGAVQIPFHNTPVLGIRNTSSNFNPQLRKTHFPVATATFPLTTDDSIGMTQCEPILHKLSRVAINGDLTIHH